MGMEVEMMVDMGMAGMEDMGMGEGEGGCWRGLRGWCMWM